MNIIAVDDEQFVLRDIEQTIREAVPECDLFCFNTPAEALRFAEENTVGVAFLDIEMSGMNGLALAKKLKDIYGKTNIVFVTGFSHYAVDAFSISASGYLLKPVSVKAVANAMEQLRNPLNRDEDKKVRVQTFGNVEIFVGGGPLHFPRSKAKELFAYLIHKKGTGSTVKELSAVLFEDRDDSISLQKQMQTVISTMMKTLEDNDVKDVVIKRFNSLAVDINKVDCDYYRFLKWEPEAVNAYTGEYMSNYSWAEFTIGYLDKKVL